MITKVQEFIKIVDDIYGVYLDSTYGFDTLRNNFAKIHDKRPEEKRIFYGKGNPNNKNSCTLHCCTQEEFLIRNEVNGRNYKIIANLCLVQIYQYWENHYRKEIAKEICREKIEVDVMGDLRHFRNSIIHHGGIAIEDMRKCKILNWYQMGEDININKGKFEEIVRCIRNQINSINN